MRQHAFISLTLFILSLLLRIFLVNKGAYNADCINLATQAEKLLYEGKLHYIIGFGFPLAIIIASFFILVSSWVHLTDPIMAVNYMSVVFGALCIPVFYYLSLSLANKTTAITSALLLSLCPIFLGNSLFGMTHTPALFFQLLAMLLSLTFLKEKKGYQLILSALCFGFSGAIRFQDMVLMTPVMCYILIVYRNAPESTDSPLGHRIIQLIYFLSIVTGTIFLFHLPYLIDQFRSDYFQQLNFYQEVSLVYFDPVFLKAAFMKNVMYLIQTLSILGFIIALFSLAIVYREKKPLFWLLLIWIAPSFILFCHLFTIAPRHQILMIPAFILLACYTLSKFLILKRNLFRVTSLAIFFLIVPVFLYYF